MTALGMAADILGLILLCLGIIPFIFEAVGLCKYKFILNRMHIAGMGDSLGLFMCMAGLMLISGLNFTTLKFALIVLFMWMTSPTSSHLISGLEVLTEDELDEYADVRVDDVKSYVDCVIEDKEDEE